MTSQEHELTADVVRERLAGILPGRVRHQGVRVGGSVFPVKQAIEVATGRPREEFTSKAALQHFAELGFELVGVEPSEVSTDPAADVVTALSAYLTAEGWQIEPTSVPLDGNRHRQVTASRDDDAGSSTVSVQVTGHPIRQDAEQRYAAAVLAAMRVLTRRPDSRAVIALPDGTEYRDLQTETAGSLDRARIEVWWVTADGTVTPAADPA